MVAAIASKTDTNTLTNRTVEVIQWELGVRKNHRGNRTSYPQQFSQVKWDNERQVSLRTANPFYCRQLNTKLAPWKENYDKPRHCIKKQRHHFHNKGPYGQSYSFPSSHVRMYESRTIKKAGCQRIDAFELWCWRRLFRVPWTARISNQPILKEINPEYSWKDWCWNSNTFGHLMWRANSLEKILMLGKIEGKRSSGREWDGWLTSPTQSRWTNSRRWWRTGKLQSIRSQSVGHDLATAQQQKYKAPLRNSKRVWEELSVLTIFLLPFPSISAVIQLGTQGATDNTKDASNGASRVLST